MRPYFSRFARRMNSNSMPAKLLYDRHGRNAGLSVPDEYHLCEWDPERPISHPLVHILMEFEPAFTDPKEALRLHSVIDDGFHPDRGLVLAVLVFAGVDLLKIFSYAHLVEHAFEP